MSRAPFRTYAITLVKEDVLHSCAPSDDNQLENETLEVSNNIFVKDASFLLELSASKYKHMEAGDDMSTFATTSDDIEDLTVDLVPLERFKKKGKLSVTDFSAQLWCEKQLEFTLITGRKRVTPSMIAGTLRHETLEREDHEIVEIEVYTREDALGLRLLNSITLLDQLAQRGRVREVWVFGIVDNIVIRGIIDQLELESEETPAESYCGDGGVVVGISDTKTRSTANEPTEAQKRTSAIQLQLYWWMVDQLRRRSVDFSALFRGYQCDGDAPFQTAELQDYLNLNALIKQFQEAFAQLPPLNPSKAADAMEMLNKRLCGNTVLKIEYECEGIVFSRCRIPYSNNATLYALQDLLSWWQGYRESEAVLCSERWKCRRCDFLDMCSSSPLNPEEIKSILAERSKEQLPVLHSETLRGESGSPSSSSMVPTKCGVPDSLVVSCSARSCEPVGAGCGNSTVLADKQKVGRTKSALPLPARNARVAEGVETSDTDVKYPEEQFESKRRTSDEAVGSINKSTLDISYTPGSGERDAGASVSEKQLSTEDKDRLKMSTKRLSLSCITMQCVKSSDRKTIRNSGAQSTISEQHSCELKTAGAKTPKTAGTSTIDAKRYKTW